VSAVAEKLDSRVPIGGVHPRQVALVWDRVEPILARVVKPHTGYSLESVLTELQLANMQLWVIGDFQGVVVTQIYVRPLHKVLWVQFLAGDHMQEWLDDWVETQDEYARSNDCKAIEFCGRHGWNKIRERHRDYKSMLTVFRKELD
jgi:hypothetical protein